jgi:alpha-1,2-mannosyltransferase
MRRSSIGDLWLLGVAAAAVLFAQTWTRAHRAGGIDLNSYLEASRTVLHGGNPYASSTPFPYVYPMFLAFALIPLALLGPDVALPLWFAALTGALVWTTAAAVRTAYPSLQTRPLTPFLFVFFAVGFPVIQSNLRNGQVNFAVVALCLLVFGAAKARGDFCGAFAWAVALAVKLVPAVLLPYFALRRRWRLIASGLALSAALCLLPIVTMGASAVSASASYVATFAAGSFGVLHGADPLDFSVGGNLVRLFPSVSPLWLRAIGALAPLAVATFADWRARSGDFHTFVLYLAMIPLASPKSEVHHFAFALPAAALAGAALWYDLTALRSSVAGWLSLSMAAYAAATMARSLADVGFCISSCALAAAIIALMTERPAVSVPDSRTLAR